MLLIHLSNLFQNQDLEGVQARLLFFFTLSRLSLLNLIIIRVFICVAFWVSTGLLCNGLHDILKYRRIYLYISAYFLGSECSRKKIILVFLAQYSLAHSRTSCRTIKRSSEDLSAVLHHFLATYNNEEIKPKTKFQEELPRGLLIPLQMPFQEAFSKQWSLSIPKRFAEVVSKQQNFSITF